MGNLVDELLKGVDDTVPLIDEMEDICALRDLLDSYVKYRNRYDATLPLISEQSTGKEFKAALNLLPATIRIQYLSAYHDKLFGDCTVKPTPIPISPEPVAPVPISVDSKYDGVKERMIRFIIFAFFGLTLITIVTVAYLSISGKEIPDGQIFTTIITYTVELLKVIAGN